MNAPSPRVAHADESEAEPGFRVWHIALDPSGPSKVAVTWKPIADNAIEVAELRDMMYLSETTEVFAAMVLDRTEEIVGEPMPAHVANRLRREIIRWCGDNHVAIGELRADRRPEARTVMRLGA
jgi:hypothetical protein